MIAITPISSRAKFASLSKLKKVRKKEKLIAATVLMSEKTKEKVDDDEKLVVTADELTINARFTPEEYDSYIRSKNPHTDFGLPARSKREKDNGEYRVK